MVAKGAAEVMSVDVEVGEGVYETIQYLRQDNVDLRLELPLESLELPLEREGWNYHWRGKRGGGG